MRAENNNIRLFIVNSIGMDRAICFIPNLLINISI